MSRYIEMERPGLPSGSQPPISFEPRGLCAVIPFREPPSMPPNLIK